MGIGGPVRCQSSWSSVCMISDAFQKKITGGPGALWFVNGAKWFVLITMHTALVLITMHSASLLINGKNKRVHWD